MSEEELIFLPRELPSLVDTHSLKWKGRWGPLLHNPNNSEALCLWSDESLSSPFRLGNFSKTFFGGCKWKLQLYKWLLFLSGLTRTAKSAYIFRNWWCSLSRPSGHFMSTFFCLGNTVYHHCCRLQAESICRKSDRPKALNSCSPFVAITLGCWPVAYGVRLDSGIESTSSWVTQERAFMYSPPVLQRCLLLYQVLTHQYKF